MNRRTHIPEFIFSLFFVAILSACNGSGDSGGTGTMSMSVTDAPVDGAQSVVVEFTGVTLKPQNGSQFDINFPSPKRIDLLALQGNDSMLLFDQQTVPAGHYEWARLHVNASDCADLPSVHATGSYIVLDDGSVETLQVPSGSQSGLKLVSGFTVAAGGISNFTVDFDLRKSVVKPNGQDCHFLKPALRIVDNTQVGTIAGTVDPALLVGANCQDADPATGNAVYVFQGNAVTPDDVDGVAPDPVSSASVLFNNTTQKYEYEAGFLLSGPYTVALTCQAELDNPETSDGILFQQSANVPVVVNQSATHNFTVP